MEKNLIVCSTACDNIEKRILKNSQSVLDAHLVEYEVVEVPSVFELPAAVKFAYEINANTNFIILGCLIKDLTSSTFSCQISQSTIHLLQKIIVKYSIAAGIGIIFADNIYHAMELTGITGINAASTMLCMKKLKRSLREKNGSDT